MCILIIILFDSKQEDSKHPVTAVYSCFLHECNFDMIWSCSLQLIYFLRYINIFLTDHNFTLRCFHAVYT
jgi:hypothetical protein